MAIRNLTFVCGSALMLAACGGGDAPREEADTAAQNEATPDSGPGALAASRDGRS